MGFTATLTAWLVQADVLVFAAIWGLEPLVYAGLLSIGAAGRRRLLRPGRARYRVLLLKAAPVAFHSLMVAIYYRFDQIYIQFRFGEIALAQYAAPARLAEVGNLAFGVVVLVMAPPMIRSLQAGAGIPMVVQAGLWGIAVLTVGASLLCLAIGGAVLSLVFGAGFSSGAAILAVYVLSTAFVGYAALASQALSARGDTGVQAIAGATGAAVNVAAVIVLCEPLGLIGAAWGTVLAYGASAIVLWVALRRSLAFSALRGSTARGSVGPGPCTSRPGRFDINRCR
jgi:O-antigen/teichoic acid export membrane protein